MPYTPTVYDGSPLNVTVAKMNKGEAGIQTAQAAAEAVAVDVAVIKEAPLNVQHSTYGAVGDGSNDDTAEIQAALTAAGTTVGNVTGGHVYLPRGEYKISSVLNIPYNVTVGGDGKGEFLQAYGASTIKVTHNGVGVQVQEGRYGWALRNLAISGDTTQASQDLLKIGEGNNALPVDGGTIENVYVSKAGRDCIVFDDALKVRCDGLYAHKAKRYGMRTAGQSNALMFSACQFREADQWGIWWGGGSGTFDECVIEANSAHATLSYGGMVVDPNDPDIAAFCSVRMIGTHFEQNSGTAGGGKALQIDAGGRVVAFTEIGTTYTDSVVASHCSTSQGTFTSIGILSNFTTHLVNASSGAVMFLNPQQVGAGSFSINDITGTVTQVVNGKYRAPNPVVTKTTSYTLAAGDADSILEMNSASGQVFTIPPFASVAFPVGTTLEFVRVGAGTVTITPGAGVTIPNAIEGAGTSSRTITSQWTSVAAYQRATNQWVLSGSLT